VHNVNFRSEKFLHWWAAVTVVVLGLVTFTSRQDFPTAVTHSAGAQVPDIDV
jgi:hypothetical protein